MAECRNFFLCLLTEVETQHKHLFVKVIDLSHDLMQVKLVIELHICIAYFGASLV